MTLLRATKNLTSQIFYRDFLMYKFLKSLLIKDFVHDVAIATLFFNIKFLQSLPIQRQTLETNATINKS